MPPAKKTETAPIPAMHSQLLKLGDIVSIVSGGRTLPSYEVLDFDDKFVKFRGSVHVAPQTEIVLIPWQQIEAIGLVGQR